MRRSALLSPFIGSLGVATAILFPCSGSNSSSPEDAGVDAPPQREASDIDTSVAELPDAALCVAHPLTTQPQWHPPTELGRDVCTPAQIEGYLDSCLFGTSDAVCTAYRQQNAACAACMYTTQDDVTWGPVILYEKFPAGYLRSNFTGCIATALGDVTENGCGAAYQLFQECQRLACSGCPLVTDQKTYDKRAACERSDAIDDICAAQLVAYNTKCNVLPKRRRGRKRRAATLLQRLGRRGQGAKLSDVLVRRVADGWRRRRRCELGA